MKFLLLYLAIALPIGYFFGEEEYERCSRMQEISRAPAFAPAKFEELLSSKGKRSESFRVRFSYEVNATRYVVTTTSTDQQGALAYIADANTQIAYSARNPAIGTLKRYYDLRNPEKTMSEVMLVVAVLALLLALPVALVVAWRLGWLRRKNRQPEAGPSTSAGPGG